MSESTPEGLPGHGAAVRGRILVCGESAPALAALLGRYRYDVRATATAAEALAAALAGPVDVVIADAALPDLPGEALCRAVKDAASLHGVAVVLLEAAALPAGEPSPSARGEPVEPRPEDDDEGLADDYLQSPVRERELLARLASLLRLRRTVLALEERTLALEALNRTLASTQGELVRAERLAAVGSLAAGLAHEVSNPLAVIKASVSSLDRTLGDIQAAGIGIARAPPGDRAAGAELARALEEARDVAESLADGSRRLERLAADLRVAAWKPRPTPADVMAIGPSLVDRGGRRGGDGEGDVDGEDED